MWFAHGTCTGETKCGHSSVAGVREWPKDCKQRLIDGGTSTQDWSVRED